MKITAIKIQNFIGARNVDVTMTKPVSLFAGHNHSGKSSIQEAIRMALTGESVRVSLKKEYRQLVTTGSEVGYAVVEHVGGKSAVTIPNGAHERSGNAASDAVMSFVLDAQRFAGLTDNDRRLFLFGLMGLRTDGNTVGELLKAKGCGQKLVEEIAPHLRAGFDAAHKEAQGKARDAKASWRTITGETYGAVKAATWNAAKPAFDCNELRQTREQWACMAERVEHGAGELLVMQAAAAAQSKNSERIAELREQAQRYAQIAAKLQKDEAEHQDWIVKVSGESMRVGGTPMKKEPTYACPACSIALRHDHASGALVAYTEPPIVGAVEPSSRLAEYQSARDLLARSVANDKRDLASADAAAKTLEEVERAMGDPAPAPEEIEAKRQAVIALRKELDKTVESVKSLEQDKRMAGHAEQKTISAREHHANVANWETVAEALSPSGIPGEMLAEALGPINERLAKSANAAGWKRINIGPDMSIYAVEEGEQPRPYTLLSESEKWRADAMIAEAVSFLSGVRLLVLDRVDVLDICGRDDLLFWLDGLAEDGEVDTAILFATLKEKPAIPTENIEAFWIENGRIATCEK